MLNERLALREGGSLRSKRFGLKGQLALNLLKIFGTLFMLRTLL